MIIFRAMPAAWAIHSYCTGISHRLVSISITIAKLIFALVGLTQANLISNTECPISNNEE